MMLMNLRMSMKWNMNRMIRCLWHRCWIIIGRMMIIMVVMSMMNIKLFPLRMLIKISNAGRKSSFQRSFSFLTKNVSILKSALTAWNGFSSNITETNCVIRSCSSVNLSTWLIQILLTDWIYTVRLAHYFLYYISLYICNSNINIFDFA